MIKQFSSSPEHNQPQPYQPWPKENKPSPGQRLSRNTAFLMLLMVCLASIHNHTLPDGRTVLTAVQNSVDPSWDETLGKITFVDKLVPDSLAVFFAQPGEQTLSLPCDGQLVHPWSETAPYVSFQPETAAALAVADGEVMSISHDAAEGLCLRLRHDNGLETIYYQLSQVFCREGDIVKQGDTIATLAPDTALVMDVRRDGLPADPAPYWQQPAA